LDPSRRGTHRIGRHQPHTRFSDKFDTDGVVQVLPIQRGSATHHVLCWHEEQPCTLGRDRRRGIGELRVIADVDAVPDTAQYEGGEGIALLKQELTRQTQTCRMGR
jgi:hypothetical protein